MCACEADFTCSRCAGTPADPNYLEDEVVVPEPFTAAELDAYGSDLMNDERFAG